jgi:hypothetical protein
MLQRRSRQRQDCYLGRMSSSIYRCEHVTDNQRFGRQQTHNVALVAPIADFAISIGLNGQIVSQGSVAEALQRNTVLAKEVDADLKATEDVMDPELVEVKNEAKSDGKLILSEELQLGKVKWSAGELFGVSNIQFPHREFSQSVPPWARGLGILHHIYWLYYSFAAGQHLRNLVSRLLCLAV